jgi:hypothetical protein
MDAVPATLSGLEPVQGELVQKLQVYMKVPEPSGGAAIR